MSAQISLGEVYKNLPPAKLVDTKTVSNQSTNDIIKQVLAQHNHNKADAKKIAHLFDGGNIYSTCKNIWEFLKYRVPYSVEPGNFQSTKTLSRFIYDAKHGSGKNDCKHFSNFTGSVLDALNYDFKYRFAGYSRYHNYPTHVYVVAFDELGNEILVDAVISAFDTEKPYTIKIDKKPNNKMSLYKLSGTDEPQVGNVFKRIKKTAQKAVKAVAQPVKAVANAIKQGALTLGLAIPRNAFLLLLRFNVHGWATGLSRMSWDRLKWWTEWAGGNRTELMKAIEVGSKNKRILGTVNYNDYLIPESVGAIGVEPVTVTAALASATPIIAKVTSLLNEAEKISNTVNNVTSTVNQTKQAVQTGNKAFEQLTGKKVSDIIFKKQQGQSANRSTITPTDLSRPTDAEANAVANAVVNPKSGGGNNNLLLIGGGAALLLLMFKKK